MFPQQPLDIAKSEKFGAFAAEILYFTFMKKLCMEKNRSEQIVHVVHIHEFCPIYCSIFFAQIQIDPRTAPHAAKSCRCASFFCAKASAEKRRMSYLYFRGFLKRILFSEQRA